jgi:hypothetical protein
MRKGCRKSRPVEIWDKSGRPHIVEKAEKKKK